MPMPLYIYIPVALGVATAAIFAVFMTRGEKRGSGDAFAGMAAVSGGLGAFFASAVLLLTLVPGPGTGGPVQYSAGSDEAMSLFSFRFSLFVIWFGVLCATLFQVSSLALALLTTRKKVIIGSATATALVCGAVATGFLTLGAWIPTA